LAGLSSARRDLVYVALVGLTVLVASAAADLNEELVLWVVAHPSLEWYQVEELPMAFALIGLGTGWFAFRRWRQYAAENQAHRAALEHLEVAMEAVVAANDAKTQFLAAMSHELRTPLNAILGFSEVIRDEVIGPTVSPIYREYADDIHKSGKRLLAILSDILDMAQLESGQLKFEIKPIPLAEVIHQVGRIIAPRASENGVKVSLEVVDGLVVKADSRRLQQAFLNLAHNAVKFTPSGGSVTLGGRIDGEMACLEVVDTGIGMAEKDIPRALTPFHQIDSSLRRKYQGVGLGLPLARRYVEQQGGLLALRSRVGRGTTVQIKMPLAREIAASSDAA
jgi:signal transduction histidine kinase